MQINKNTSIICLILTIISCVLTILLHPYYKLISSIVSSIFTGFIVSSVVALIGYFYEKQKIINNISDNLKSLCINLITIKDITGKIVPKVFSENDFKKLEYSTIESLTSQNVEFIKKMELKFYDGFLVIRSYQKLSTSLLIIKMNYII